MNCNDLPSRLRCKLGFVACRPLVVVGVLFLLWAGLSSPLPGQVAGRLSGSVVDPQGGAIPGAHVRVYLPGGQHAVLSTFTNEAGLFVFPGVRPDWYDLAIEAKGFVRLSLRQVKVDPAQEKSLGDLRLDLATVSESVEVTAEPQGVQLANAEVSTTVTHEQVRNLPVFDRQVIYLLRTQAGVSAGRGATVINGLRASFAAVTMDGINIQDNYLRSSSLDFIPNRIAVDQVSEVSISTSNASSALNGGAAQVNFVTPSGSNQHHGNLYWYNRNSHFAANGWFNNRDGVGKPRLNQNQFGGSVGGPVRKDKLLFYFNYESVRLKQQTLRNATILTEEARRGIFTYQDTGGAIRKIDILQARQVPVDPAISQLLQRVPDPSQANNFRIGDSLPGLLRNTVGYSFNQRANRDRDNLTAKVDYMLSTRHSLSGSYLRNNEYVDRPDLDPTFNAVPKVFTDATRNLFSVGWRWNSTSSLTNELRGGANFAPSIFENTDTFPEYLLARTSTFFTSPVSNQSLPQGRYTNTSSILDNASWLKGRHNLQFGFQSQMIRVEAYNYAGIYPTYSLGISANNPNGLQLSQLPGIRTADFAQANAMLAALAGYVSAYTQSFNITSRDSGFVPRAEERRNYRYDNYAGYVQDTWRLSRRLTLAMGVRYEYFTRVDERDGLTLQPILEGGNYISTLLNPRGVLDFAGSAIGRPPYRKDLNNFGPNVGLAWDPFGNGKTSLRAGYGITYVNDDHISALSNNLVRTNDGLTSLVTASGLNGRLTGALPQIVTPRFQVPRTFADNYALDTQTAFGIVDPNLRVPYVQQWTLGLQREIAGWVVEGRYVGNKSTKALRAFDYNQVQIGAGGFLDDFKRAQNNGWLARAAGRGFDPRYNPEVPGSQPLTVFPLLAGGGNLTNATNLGLIQRGEVGQLASNYMVTRTNGALVFFRNPSGIAANAVTNYSNANYHSLQMEVRRRAAAGLSWQANYTFSKALTDAVGDANVTTRFEPFLDFNNPGIERAPASFDLRHAFKSNFFYELPFGRNARGISRLWSGWKTSGFLTWQSGTPFSVFSNRGTFNRAARSTARNTAVSLAQGEQLAAVTGFFMTGNGPYFIHPSARGTDGRGVASDGDAPFAGQVFFNPGAGEIGSLQRRMFNGPRVFNFDFAVIKETSLGEHQSLEFRMESFNFFNHAQFYVGDETANSTNFTINNPTFGVISEQFFDTRRFQFGFYLRF